MPWEDLAKALTGEIKKEIAENYFREKLFLEESWREFEDKYKILLKKEEALIQDACRLILMLERIDLIEDFEKITGFPLKSCYIPTILESKYIKKSLFEKLKGLPFGLTSKSRFIKLFFWIYEALYKDYQVYKKFFERLKLEYDILKEETEEFYKKFDLASILTFFGKMETEGPSITTPEDKERVYEELKQKLKLSLPLPPEKRFELYAQPMEPRKVRSLLLNLAKRAYEIHQNSARDLLKLVSKKD